MRAKTIPYILVCVLLGGCFPLMVPNDPYGRYYPKRDLWSLRTESPDPEGRVCYDCLYASEYPAPEYYKYVVIRFLDSGRIIMMGVDDNHDASPFNSFRDVIIGYFRVVGSLIEIEIFSGVAMGTFYREEGRIESNGDITLYGGGIGDKRKSTVYRKVPVEGLLPLNPDW